MKTYPIAIYDAFTDRIFGGSQGAIIMDADDIDADNRLQIAKELGLPATCFVTAHSANSISARFQSTEREYPMCGHGTICLMTHLIELGVLTWNDAGTINVDLVLPTTTATVEIYRNSENRALVMLDINPPEFRSDEINSDELADLLGITAASFNDELPIETAVGDFFHLVVPLQNLSDIQNIIPNFSGISTFCNRHGIETIACLSLETEHNDHHLHVRDFCPAVGVPESAAAGTTNAALTSYLIRHELVRDDLAKANNGGIINLKAEQGLEINRPSSITSRVTMKDNAITRLQIGGTASKFLDGQINV